MLWLLLACAEGPDKVRPLPDDSPLVEADADADADSDTDADGDADSDTGADPCAALAPLADPAETRAALQSCLDAGGATLAGGLYEVDTTLHLRGATLDGGGRSTIRMVGGPNSLLTLHDDALARGLVLDANHALSDTNGAVVHFVGSRSTLRESRLGNEAGHRTGYHLTGVYFISAESADNLVEEVEITELFYGVIFVAGLDAAHANRLRAVTIHETACDGVTFAGYGELVDSEVFHAGYDCENGPIPGASIYGLGNPNGAWIERNALYDDCGNVVDLDGVRGFVLNDNVIHGPGYDWGGWATWCTGTAVVLVDSAGNTLTGNTVENNDRPNNRVGVFGDPNALFSARGAPAYSDLPRGGDNAIALVLAQRPNAPGTTTGNQLADNALRASCASPCVGLGWFASRGTGTDADGGWSASTTSYFVRNSPYGSDVGSRRCGANWYAANDTCTGAFPEGDCNADDSQHSGDWSRNDGCRDY